MRGRRRRRTAGVTLYKALKGRPGPSTKEVEKRGKTEPVAPEDDDQNVVEADPDGGERPQVFRKSHTGFHQLIDGKAVSRASGVKATAEE